MNKVHDHRRTIAQAKKYCKDSVELIENYAEMMADTTRCWCCHHRREFSENKSKSQLISEGLYFKRPACELIFITDSDHKSLHLKAALTGVPKSDEHKKNLSESHKVVLNRPDYKKKLSKAAKGKHWFNNGVKQVLAKECPEGFVKGMLKI